MCLVILDINFLSKIPTYDGDYLYDLIKKIKISVMMNFIMNAKLPHYLKNSLISLLNKFSQSL